MDWTSPENVWNSWRPASCLPDCWCEAPRYGQFIIEPSNTWTNLSFVLVGLVCLFIAVRYRDNPDRPLALVNGHSIWHILNGVALLLVYLAYFLERPASAEGSTCRRHVRLSSAS